MARVAYTWPDPCPLCGAPMEVVVKQFAGSKAPDFACTNERCTGGKGGRPFGAWRQKDVPLTPAPRSQGPAPAIWHHPTPPGFAAETPRGKSWAELRIMYQTAREIALTTWEGYQLSDEAMVAATATILIQAERMGLGAP